MFFVRRVSGESMTPTLKPGQIIVCRKDRNYTYAKGRVVVATVNGLEVVKRITKIENEKIYLSVEDNKHAHNGEFYAEINSKAVNGVVIWPKV